MKKIILILSAVIMIAAITVGATYAYFAVEIEGENIVTVGRVKIHVTPNSSNVLKGVKVYPGQTFDTERYVISVDQRSATAWLRLKFNATSQASDFSEIITKQTEWKYRDGYFYYKNAVPAGGSTDFVGTITINPALDGSTSNLGLNMTVEAIQSERITNKDGNGFPMWPDVQIVPAK